MHSNNSIFRGCSTSNVYTKLNCLFSAFCQVSFPVNRIPSIILLLSLNCLFACKKDKPIIKISASKNSKYIFLGHIYNKENRVDPRLEKIDFSTYQGVWLGGDLCAETTKKRSTLDYLDAIFDLGNENTHWAVGNHDVRNGNLQWIQQTTGRNLFYATTSNDLTVAVSRHQYGACKWAKCYL